MQDKIAPVHVSTTVKCSPIVSVATVDPYSGTGLPHTIPDTKIVDMVVPSEGTNIRGEKENEMRNDGEYKTSVKPTNIVAYGPCNFVGLPNRPQPTTSSVEHAVWKRLTAPIPIDKTSWCTYRSKPGESKLLKPGMSLVEVCTQIILPVLLKFVNPKNLENPLNLDLNKQEYLKLIKKPNKRLRFAKILTAKSHIKPSNSCEMFIKNEIYGGEGGHQPGLIPTKPPRFICNVPDSIVRDTVLPT